MRAHIAIFLLLVCIPFTYGTSFDCAKASTQVEKLICSNAELSKLDELLSVSYAQGNALSKSKTEFMSSQRRWLIEKRNTCADTPCIKNAYETRMHEIELDKDVSATESTSADSVSGTGSRDTSPEMKAVWRTGSYHLIGEKWDSGILTINSSIPGSSIFSIEATNCLSDCGTDSSLSHIGSIEKGIIQIKGSSGQYQDTGENEESRAPGLGTCILHFSRHPNDLIVVKQAGECWWFGQGVSVAGRYKLN